ncbi:transposable element Tc1 transposase [Trichonephila clavipes]|nr:transposable element Tc1 transposase [Trichonephila clavipes]
MDDNARPHMVNKFLERQDIHQINWLVRSLDINPVEYSLDDLRKAPPPRNIQGLKAALLNKGDRLSQELINSIISNIKSRCEVCMIARWELILY